MFSVYLDLLAGTLRLTKEHVTDKMQRNWNKGTLKVDTSGIMYSEICLGPFICGVINSSLQVI